MRVEQYLGLVTFSVALICLFLLGKVAAKTIATHD